MADYASFKVGSAGYPLSAATTNSLLKDGDPTLYLALDFWTAMIAQYGGARLTAEATAVGHSLIAAQGPVAMRLPYDPAPWMLEEHTKFPLFAIARDTVEHIYRTTVWSESVWTWQVSYSLPPLSPAQAERMLPFLKTVDDIIAHTTLQGWDPSYTPPGGALGDRVWGLAGIDKIEILSARIGNLEGAASSNGNPLWMPTWMCTMKVYERTNPTAGTALVAVDLLSGLRSSDGTTIADFVDAYSDTLSFTNIAPTHGPLAGLPVTLTGTGFSSAATVLFGSTPATRVALQGDGTLTCQAPASTTAGPVTVTVTVGSASKTFTYVYEGFTIGAPSPSVLPATLGGSVVIPATGVLDPVTVKVGGVPITVTGTTPTSITFAAPTHAAGSGIAVDIVNGDGARASTALTYNAAPTLASVSPNHGPATLTTPVTLTGTGFVTGSAPSFGGTLATGVSVVNATTITCTAPSGTAGASTVRVTNPDTQATGTVAFTFDAAPTFGSVSPTTFSSTTPLAGTVTGTGFVATPGITLGGTAATGVSLVSSTSLTFTSPTHTAGTGLPIVVTNPDGQTCSGTVTYVSLAPSTVAGNVLWLMSDQGVTSSGGIVTTWSDQSGNGRDFTQPTSGNRPTITSAGSGINSIASIKFVASSTQSLIGPSLSALTSGAEVFLVHKPTSDGSTQVCHWRFGSQAQSAFYPYIDRLIYDNFGSSSNRFHPSTTVANAAQIYNVVATGSEWTALIDGTQIFTSGSNTVGWDAAGSLLGASSAGGITPGAWYDGLMSACIIYDHKLSTADRATVMSGLRAKYGTP